MFTRLVAPAVLRLHVRGVGPAVREVAATLKPQTAALVAREGRADLKSAVSAPQLAWQPRTGKRQTCPQRSKRSE